MIIFHNGNILTQNKQYPLAEKVAMQGGKIVGIDANMPDTLNAQFVDLEGKTLMPAFNDAHIHVWKVGHLMTYMLDLRGVQSLKEMQEKIATYAAQNPELSWITARGFNEANFENKSIPTRHDLDKILKDRPLYIIRTCAHVAVANTKALEIANIDTQTRSPVGGEIRYDSNGSPNGIFSENALGLLHRHLPAPSTEQYKTMIRAAQESFLKVGIKSACDPAVHPDLMTAYKEMDKAGELKVRINAIPIRVPEGSNIALPLPTLYQSDFLKVNTVKFFADGGLSGKTAAMKRPYKGTKEYGVTRLEYETFKQWALEAQNADFCIATHAIGDVAVDLVLDVYEKIAPQNSQQLAHRIEHLGYLNQRNIRRMKAMNVHAVMQPIFIYELGKNFKTALRKDYLERTYPIKTVLDNDISLAFSSDAPVVKNFNPMMGIQNAVERKDFEGFTIGKNEKISVEDALYAYTMGAAKACGDDKNRGSIEIGKWADLVVLDKNPLQTTDNQLNMINVMELY